jgi:hypothetical protein
MQTALRELQDLIAAHYPTASFDVFYRDDPEGMRLRATVDVEDLDEVMDVVMDKLYEVQVEHGLPVYVVTAQPPHRVAAQLHERAKGQHTLVLPPLP